MWWVNNTRKKCCCCWIMNKNAFHMSKEQNNWNSKWRPQDEVRQKQILDFVHLRHSWWKEDATSSGSLALSSITFFTFDGAQSYRLSLWCIFRSKIPEEMLQLYLMSGMATVLIGQLNDSRQNATAVRNFFLKIKYPAILFHCWF